MTTMAGNTSARQYWRANVTICSVLLAIWALVSYVFGILLRPQLDAIPIGGVGLGFWFAQQGSMFTFVALIFIYTWLMNRLDRKYDVHE